MAAVVGVPLEVVESACAAARSLGVCDLANLNAPDQIVISGAVPAVLDAMRRLEDGGARLVKRLNVSGAFHSALMRGPAEKLAAYLDQFDMENAAVPVVANVTGRPETRREMLRSLLGQQIHSPVLWEACMRELRARFSGPLLEVGPGAVLKGLLRRIDRSASCESVGERAGLEALLAKIATPGR
jgi:[acyl-carrier-protein] S-malonyltransferase